jgi:hypothetical protein
MPQNPQATWTRRQSHPTPLSIAGVRGKSATRRWHLSSLLLRIPGWVLPGHEEGKEHVDAAVLLRERRTSSFYNRSLDTPHGTILIELERRVPIDLPPDREAATLENGLLEVLPELVFTSTGYAQ